MAREICAACGKAGGEMQLCMHCGQMVCRMEWGSYALSYGEEASLPFVTLVSCKDQVQMQVTTAVSQHLMQRICVNHHKKASASSQKNDA